MCLQQAATMRTGAVARSRALSPTRARAASILGRVRRRGHGDGQEEGHHAAGAVLRVLAEVVKVDGDGGREHRHALVQAQRPRHLLRAGRTTSMQLLHCHDACKAHCMLEHSVKRRKRRIQSYCWSSAGCTRALPVCVGTTVMLLRSFAISVTFGGSTGRGLSGCAASMVLTTCKHAPILLPTCKCHF